MTQKNFPKEPLVIAIDGPAAAGKGTLAQKIAHYYDLAYLDTGLLYRAVARFLLDHDQDLNNSELAEKAAQNLQLEQLADTRLRNAEAGEAASLVSIHPQVRAALLEFQQNFAKRPEGAILDGRDIGTVIAPNAPVKFFVTAQPEIRAHRRYKELINRGEHVLYENILSDVYKRDERDAQRQEAPLLPAKDAFIIDTSTFSPDQVFEQAQNIIKRKGFSS